MQNAEMQDLTPMRAHAKINLALSVGPCQPDGYHQLRTIFQSLGLHDTIEFAEAPGPLAIVCDDPTVPVDARNLVWKAAALVWEAAGRRGEPAGVRVTLRKRIPAQGGLGGGSADAAVAVAAFAGLWGACTSPAARDAVARRLGADVPFFLHGGTALGTGRGDELSPLADLPEHQVVLVFPPFGVSTADAYRWLDEDRARGIAESRPAIPPLPCGTVHLADGTTVAVANDLEAPVAARHPEVGQIRDALRAAGAGAAAMSGSGSTVFGLFRSPDMARAAAAALDAAGWRTERTTTVGRVEAQRFLV
jgi:4-diphosphocytidyl-2-C-methyl-D-erythritol kinase